MKQSIILINPWVYDFAAYDLWAKPLGLLYLTSQLKASGFKVHLIDCLDVNHPGLEKREDLKKPVRRKFGTGKFWKQKIPKPHQLSTVARNYSQYGLPVEIFKKELKGVREPAAILVTSLMTYWYPGVFEAIRIAKAIHPGVPVILGGIYAALCPEHAMKYSHADIVISNPSRIHSIKIDGFSIEYVPHFLAREKTGPFQPYPSFDLLGRLDYICLLSSYGCPFRCPYCASHYISPYFIKREPLELLEEVLFWSTSYKVVDFAFYDDALLVDAENHICLFLEGIINTNLSLRFHCPNGLHIKYIDKKMAKLLYKAGFKTLRLGLETSDYDLHKNLGEKFSEGQFERAVQYLKDAGFSTAQIGAYILMGLPGQKYKQVAETIKFVGKAGAMPYLSEYSPLPKTRMWEDAVRVSRFDLASEPLFHNNTIFPCWNGDVFNKVGKLKKMVQDSRREVREK